MLPFCNDHFHLEERSFSAELEDPLLINYIKKESALVYKQIQLDNDNAICFFVFWMDYLELLNDRDCFKWFLLKTLTLQMNKQRSKKENDFPKDMKLVIGSEVFNQAVDESTFNYTPHCFSYITNCPTLPNPRDKLISIENKTNTKNSNTSL